MLARLMAAFLVASCLTSSVLAAETKLVRGTIPTDIPVGVAIPVAVPALPGMEDIQAIEFTIDVGATQIATETTLAQYEPGNDQLGMKPTVWFSITAKPEHRGKRITIRTSPLGEAMTEPPASASTSRYADPMLHIVSADGRPVLSYWHGDADSKNPKGYPLNDFIHPLYGLDGEVLTAQSPEDHIHHRGIFWAWVRNERADKWKGDWWLPIRVHAEAGKLDTNDGPLFTHFVAHHKWTYQEREDLPADPYVDERVVCRVFEANERGRIVDVDITLIGIGEGVRIGGQMAKDKGYSGLTIRFTDATEVRLAKHDRPIYAASINHLRAKWVDWTGRFRGPDGQRQAHRSGAALMVHPSHPDYAPEWITRYYGPINVAYPGLDMLALPDGKPLNLRYRFWVHRGDADEGRVAQQYAAYIADWQWMVAE